MSSFAGFAGATIRRDIALAVKGGGGWLHGIVFYAVFISFMAFGIGPEAADLREIAGATVWLASLFALQLAAADMFVADLEDGTLRTLAVEQSSLLPYVIGKTIGIVIVVGLPLLIATPLVLIMFSAPVAQAPLTLITLLVGITALILAAIVASAINAALRGGGRFTAILAAPLSIPVLIFGIEASNTALISGEIWTPEFQLLLALTLFLGAIAPGFATLALRLGLE